MACTPNVLLIQWCRKYHNVLACYGLLTSCWYLCQHKKGLFAQCRSEKKGLDFLNSGKSFEVIYKWLAESKIISLNSCKYKLLDCVTTLPSSGRISSHPQLKGNWYEWARTTKSQACHEMQAARTLSTAKQVLHRHGLRSCCPRKSTPSVSIKVCSWPKKNPAGGKFYAQMIQILSCLSTMTRYRGRLYIT